MRQGTPGSPSSDKKPSLLLSSVSAWIDESAGMARLWGGRAGSHGTIALTERRAELFIPLSSSPEQHDEAFTMLTISAALLLGRLRRALVHAAGAVAPDGRCWLLVGDTHAGKTTTTINLVRGGWGFLSDDHVVAALDEAGPFIEGWPRPFHVDEGWDDGRITGIRKGVEPAEFGVDRWTRSAPLAGLLFPMVNADAPTRLEPIPSATALTLLIRQSPWLLADRECAADVLDLLGRMAALPAFRLSAGRDSYADSGALLRAIDCQLSAMSEKPSP